MITSYNTGFFRTSHAYLKSAVDLLYATENENVLTVIQKVERNWGVVYIRFSHECKSDGRVDGYEKSISVHEKYKSAEMTHRVAMIIFYELINSQNEFHFSNLFYRRSRDEFVFCREISEWKGTLLPYYTITKELIEQHAWPVDTVCIVPSNPDLFFIQEVLMSHADLEAKRWDEVKCTNRGPATNYLPRPIYTRNQTELLVNLINIRVQREDSLNPKFKEKVEYYYSVWKSRLEKEPYDNAAGYPFTSQKEIDDFVVNGRLVLLGSPEELRSIHAHLWQVYEQLELQDAHSR